MYSKFAGVWSQWSGFLREKTGIGFYSYLLDLGPLECGPTALFSCVSPDVMMHTNEVRVACSLNIPKPKGPRQYRGP